MLPRPSAALWAPSIPTCWPLCKFFCTSQYPAIRICTALHSSLLTEARNPCGRTSIYTVSRSYHQPVMEGEGSSSKSRAVVSNHQVAIAEETFRRYTCTECNRDGSGVAILWFRNDLRILDNEALYRAWKSSEALLPVYCIDPRLFGKTHYFGFPKTGELRAQFLLESLVDLKSNLLKRGLNLLVRHGKPEEILPSIAQSIEAHTVYAHKETCSEELMVERLVSEGLEEVALPSRAPASLNNCHPKLQLVWGCTLYHLDDLPFKPEDVPDVYTQFRKAVERECKVQPCYKLPESLAPLPMNSVNEIEVWGEIPSLHQLGLCMKDQSSLGVMRFIGGERAALARVHEYFWEKDMLRLYKETRNGMLGPDYSTKFSPWLAFGSLSPRYIYEEVKKYESERVANSSTYWILFELTWRDYFRFISIKYGNSIFHLGGPRRIKGIEWGHDPTLFQCWRDGCTGYPLIDANMKELLSTGFMSNRGRQEIICRLSVHFWCEIWVLTGGWELSGLRQV